MLITQPKLSLVPIVVATGAAIAVVCGLVAAIYTVTGAVYLAEAVITALLRVTGVL